MAQGKTAAAKKRKPAKQPAKPAKRAKRAKPAEQPAKQPAEQPKSRPAFARLSALDFDHRYLGSHGEEYEIASRHLNDLRRKVNKEGLKPNSQAMHDELAQLRLDVQQIPGEAFDPPVQLHLRRSTSQQPVSDRS